MITVAFIGNPNCGKTTLFNAYTGARLKVANWPGVTVEKVEGSFRFQGEDIRLVDLPGTYSLTSYTMEEQVSRDFILSDEVDVVIDVVDASSLERNLYLTLQLLELGKPVVVALNMMDIVEKRGMEIDLHRLPEMLGAPVIPVSARKRRGLEVLMHAVLHHKEQAGPDPLIHEHKNAEKTRHRHDHHSEYAMVYSDEIEDRIRVINEKYDFIEEIVEECLMGRARKAELTDRIDRILTHRIWSIPVFLCIMALVFFLTFTVGDFLKGYVEILIEQLSGLVLSGLTAAGCSAPLISLICDGIIAGVGGIITFLPNIFILFLALALLEDSGYMSRVAYVMDGIMGRLGLSGRAFIPMLLGFGCTVPAIMASRALENRRDRLKTMLVTPFMSCSARLPVYILFSELFFPDYAMLAAYSMYVIGIFMAILVAFVISRMDRSKTENALLIELPEYKLPSLRTVFIYVWEKVKDFLQKAGTTIFAASVVMWLILNFGPAGYTTDMTQSFGAQIGRFIVPLFVPCGLGFWQIVVALIAGISAKEVVVSSCAVLFGVPNVNSSAGMASLYAGLSAIGFGPLNAVCLMVFCLLYVPCAATIITIRRESGSRRWTALSVIFQLATAWVMSFLIYQIGSRLL